ncbi:MAG: branched-chain amino acid aminotransferase [Oligoflexia bacterium]|nr:branched-chain amino acid aminotransferase [Oligoflexia bacterium]
MQINRTYTSRGTSIDVASIGAFGSQFADKMFVMKYNEGLGWHDAAIRDFEPFVLSPASLVFHYAQEIFEGQKAYKWEDGRIVLFRPEMNVDRFNKSAERMCMPVIDEEFFMRILMETTWENRDWIPQKDGYSLYIRPTMIATEPVLGVRPSSEYIFFIINSPIGHYFSEGYKPVNILVSDGYVRAVQGGVGEAKTGGNYAASLRIMKDARKKGFTQVLWLDGRENRYIEEVGTMNMCFIREGKLVTPALTGSILHGVTRDSVMVLARHMGIDVEETRLDIDEVCRDIDSGKITECFGCGTACVISPISGLCFREKIHTVDGGKIGKITQSVYDYLTGIQYGKIKDDFGWIREVTELSG